MLRGISVADARKIVLSDVTALPAETVASSEASGRVLAESVAARFTHPPADCSAMDGYAVAASDLAGASGASPVVLSQAYEIAAGNLTPPPLPAGQVARIFTGAPLPAGADSVVRQEDTRSDGADIAFEIAPEVGDHVRRAGEDVRAGDLVLAAGTLLRSPQIGMLAGLARTLVRVHRRPRVTLISGGDELVEPDRAVGDGRIVSSNAYALEAECRALGAVPSNLGIAGDSPGALEAILREGLATDVIVSSAGVSVGDHDHVRPVLEQLGCEVAFWGVNMKPGFPVVFGRFASGPLVFGLPGNPVSAFVTFLLFVAPTLRKLLGYRRLFLPKVTARVAETLTKTAGRTHFVRVCLDEGVGGYEARTTGNQSSGVFRSLATADGLLEFPAEATEIRVGDEAVVHLIDPVRLGSEA